MKKVIFAHGKPPREKYENPALPKPHEANWFPWAKKQLAFHGIGSDVPALPKPYYPVFSDWSEAFPVKDINPKTGLVGFSTGAEFLLRLFSEDRGLQAEKLVLVAPWKDTAGKYEDFSKYTLDLGICERIGRLTIISSLDDSQAIQENTSNLAQALPTANVLELDGYGHFMIGNNMVSEEFPELITTLTSD